MAYFVLSSARCERRFQGSFFFGDSEESLMRNLSAAAMLVSVGLAMAAPALAGNLVTNGSFEATTNGGGQLAYNTDAIGWSIDTPNNSYTFLFTPGSADNGGVQGQYGAVGLWGPGNGIPNGLTATSPDGGNFIGADPTFQNNSGLSQTLNGLVVGDKYAIGFWFAGAQQQGFFGATTEGWTVNLGEQSQNTATLINADQGFTGWQHVTMDFTATDTSEVLSFLSFGSPTATQPPFALLDGVTASQVPEPATWGLVVAGLCGMAGFGAWRRRKMS
jgi:hypothetical protein